MMAPLDRLKSLLLPGYLLDSSPCTNVPIARDFGITHPRITDEQPEQRSSGIAPVAEATDCDSTMFSKWRTPEKKYKLWTPPTDGPAKADTAPTEVTKAVVDASQEDDAFVFVEEDDADNDAVLADDAENPIPDAAGEEDAVDPIPDPHKCTHEEEAAQAASDLPSLVPSAYTAEHPSEGHNNPEDVDAQSAPEEKAGAIPAPAETAVTSTDIEARLKHLEGEISYLNEWNSSRTDRDDRAFEKHRDCCVQQLIRIDSLLTQVDEALQTQAGWRGDLVQVAEQREKTDGDSYAKLSKELADYRQTAADKFEIWERNRTEFRDHMKRCDNRGKGFAEVIKSVGVANGEFEEHFRTRQEFMWTSIEKADERVDEATRKLNQIEDSVKKLAKISKQTEQAISALAQQFEDLQKRATIPLYPPA